MANSIGSIRFGMEQRIISLAERETPVHEIKSDGFLELVQDLLKVASDKVRYGPQVGAGREQFIRSWGKRLAMRLRDDRVTPGDRGDMSTGLYVYSLSTDAEVDLENRYDVFMLPRDIKFVDQSVAQRINGYVDLERLRRITAAIKYADPISKRDFYDLHNEYLLKLRGSRMSSDFR